MSKWTPIIILFTVVALFFGGMLFAGTWIMASCEYRGEAYFNGSQITCVKERDDQVTPGP